MCFRIINAWFKDKPIFLLSDRVSASMMNVTINASFVTASSLNNLSLGHQNDFNDSRIISKAIEESEEKLTTDVTEKAVNPFGPQNGSDFFDRYINLPVQYFGVVCNILVIFLMLRPAIRKKSISLYYLSLAVSDLMQLIWLFNFDFLHKVMNYPVWGCRFVSFFSLFFATFSCWIVMAVAVERTFIISLPLKAHVFLRRSVATKIIFGIFFLATVFSSQNLWANYYCSIDNSIKFAQVVKRLITITLWLCVTLIVLIITSTIMIRKLLQQAKQQKALRESTNKTREKNSNQARNKGETEKANSERKLSKHNSATLSVLLICICFVILNLPFSIVILLQDAGVSYGGFILIYKVVLLLHKLNFGVNLFLYIIPGGAFRREFYIMLFPCCLQSNESESKVSS